MPAQHLRVHVSENGQMRADLSFPAVAAAHLPDLLPGDLEEKLRLRGVDVATIAMTVAEKGFPPGDLFRMIDGDKQVRVWLE